MAGTARAVLHACVLLALVASGAVAATPHVAASDPDAETGLRVVGVMRGPHQSFSSLRRGGEGADVMFLTAMVVDQRNRIGFSIAGDEIAMYDLESFEKPAQVISGDEFSPSPSGHDATRWAVDTENERVVGIPGPAGAPGCTPGSRANLPAIDYRAETDGRRQMRPTVLSLPCVGLEGVEIRAVSYDEPSAKLYLSAATQKDDLRELLATQPCCFDRDDAGSPLLIRQTDTDSDAIGFSADVDWQVDLRLGGCGRRDRTVQWVARTPDAVLTYCYDTKPLAGGLGSGLQGYVVKIPLDGDDIPRTVDGGPPVVDPVSGTMLNAEIRRTPALAGPVTPFVDPVSGLVILLTSGRTNGNAFWVFDPGAERFVGTVTGGISDEPPNSNAFGFDPDRGRAYLLTAGGILVAPVRSVPLPTGELVPVLTNAGRKEGFIPAYGLSGANPFINDKISVLTDVAACGGCTRLFVPITEAVPCPNNEEPDDTSKQQCPAWVVLEDHIPDPVVLTPDDPDRATLDIAEEPGKTDRVVSGRALVAGAQLIATGGIPRTVNQSIPGCVPLGGAAFLSQQLANAADAVGGFCLARMVLAAGHRQFALGWSDVDVGTGTGATADASGLAVAEEDAATDRELKRLGECHASTFESSTGIDPQETAKPIAEQLGIDDFEACEPAQGIFRSATGDDLGRGTEGGTDEEPGAGFPVPSSHCFDGGSTPTEDEQPDTPDGLRARVFASSVSCDAARSTAGAEASSATLALPDPSDPVVSVAGTATDSASALTTEGQVTMAVASAYGVRVGPLTIGEVRSVAVSRAQGRPGTAHAEVTRLWCGVQFEGESVEDGCLDATSDDARRLTDAVNQALGRVRISVPAALEEATPGGFQAVVTKDPDQRGADQAVNDDDSHTVPGMRITVFNDGAEGRNRYVVDLAGVHTEARYGIVLLPQFTSPEFTTPDFGPSTVSLTEPGTPGTSGSTGRVVLVEETVGGSGASTSTLGRPEAPDSTFRQVVESPVQAARAGLRWLWNNPREAALLFLLWSVLAAPVYLGSRRRAFERVVAQHVQHEVPSA